MKKITAFLTAFICLSACFSCSDKKKGETDSISQDIPVETIAEEIPFMEYDAKEFAKIIVPLKITEDTAPVDIIEHKFPIDRLEERIPPCKSCENPEKYWGGYESYLRHHEDGAESWVDDMYQNFLNSLNKPVAPRVYNSVYMDNYYFFVADYDIDCIGNHEWTAYCWNTETDEIKEIYTHSELTMNDYDSGYYIDYVQNSFCDGVYLQEISENGKFIIKAIDIETLAEETIYESDGFIYIGDTVYNEEFDCNGIIIAEMDDAGNAADSKIYLPSQKKFTDYVTNTQSDTTDSLNMYSFNMYKNGFKAVAEKPEGSRKYDIVTEHYRLHTGYTSVDVLYASDERVMFIVRGNKTILHTFDFKDMHHYTTEIEGIGKIFGAMNGNLIALSGDSVGSFAIHNYSSPAYYLCPETGFAYELFADSVNTSMIVTNNFASITREKYVRYEAYNNTEYLYSIPDSVFVISEKE